MVISPQPRPGAKPRDYHRQIQLFLVQENDSVRVVDLVVLDPYPPKGRYLEHLLGLTQRTPPDESILLEFFTTLVD